MSAGREPHTIAGTGVDQKKEKEREREREKAESDLNYHCGVAFGISAVERA